MRTIAVSSRAHRAFTLMEVIVVLIVMAIAMGMIVPRVSTSTHRQSENMVRAVSSMVALCAQRSVAGSEISALVYDAEERTLRVEVLRQERGNYDRTDREWRSDPFAPEVRLETCRVQRVVMDGVSFNQESFRLVFEPGVQRPQVSMTIAEGESEPDGYQRSDQRVWQIDLPSYALRPVVSGLSTGAVELGAPQPIDLDAMGQVEESW
ncbi:MAG: type II secretion system protein [Phycisphaerales bacterium JB050]